MPAWCGCHTSKSNETDYTLQLGGFPDGSWELLAIAEVWVTLAAAGITAAAGAGTAIYSSNQQKKASDKQAAALQSGTREFEPEMLGDPAKLDMRKVSQDAVDIPYDKLMYANELSSAVNRLNYAEAIRYYRKIQPSFDAIQRQTGKNALSFSRGELPSDVVSSIGRASAERGIQGGYGFGSQGGRNGALANLNLRNLGLTSLDLAKYGTNLGMNVNAQAKNLLPNLSSPTDWLLTPQQILAAEQYNVGKQNEFAVTNNGLMNQAALQNTSLANSVNQSVAGLNYQGDVTQAMGYAQAGQAVGSALGSAVGLFGGQQSQSAITNTQADLIMAQTNAGAKPDSWQNNARGLS